MKRPLRGVPDAAKLATACHSYQSGDGNEICIRCDAAGSGGSYLRTHRARSGRFADGRWRWVVHALAGHAASWRCRRIGRHKADSVSRPCARAEGSEPENAKRDGCTQTRVPSSSDKGRQSKRRPMAQCKGAHIVVGGTGGRAFGGAPLVLIPADLQRSCPATPRESHLRRLKILHLAPDAPLLWSNFPRSSKMSCNVPSPNSLVRSKSCFAMTGATPQ